MRTREWPASPKEPADFGMLTDSVYDAIMFAYDLKRRNEDEGIPWTGPPDGKEGRAVCLSAEDAFSKENLDRELYDQDRDALRVILGVALRLGIEQGMRIMREKQDFNIRMANISISELVRLHEDRPPDPAELKRLTKKLAGMVDEGAASGRGEENGEQHTDPGPGDSTAG